MSGETNIERGAAEGRCTESIGVTLVHREVLFGLGIVYAPILEDEEPWAMAILWVRRFKSAQNKAY